MKIFISLFLISVIGCSPFMPSGKHKDVVREIGYIYRNSAIDNIQDGTVKVINSPVMGSGVVIAQDKDYSYIITARHILTVHNTVAAPKNVFVIINKRDGAFINEGLDLYPAEVISISDVDHDLALLRVRAPVKVVIPLAIHLPQLGTDITACGYPYSTAMFITYGKISRYDKNKQLTFIFTNAGVVPGNSGGGIFYNGQCIAIVQASLFSTLKYNYSGGYNYGISSIDVIKWINSVDTKILARKNNGTKISKSI